MTPDPERERAMRERVQGLLAAAPEPDQMRLADALQANRAIYRRRQRGRRTIAWLAAAFLLGAGVATAGWWLGGVHVPGQGRSDSTRDAVSPPASDDSDSGVLHDKDKGSRATDRGLIYQGAE